MNEPTLTDEQKYRVFELTRFLQKDERVVCDFGDVEVAIEKRGDWNAKGTPIFIYYTVSCGKFAVARTVYEQHFLQSTDPLFLVLTTINSALFDIGTVAQEEQW